MQVYTSPSGIAVHSREPMSTAELIAFDEQFGSLPVLDEDFDDVEPFYTLGAPRLREGF